MTVSAADFKAALGRFCSGVTVVTARSEGEDVAMTASAFSSVSLSPPLVLVCVKHGGTMHTTLEAGSHFAVNILDAVQQDVSNRFGGWWKGDGGPWSGLAVSRAPHSGAAWLDGSLASLDCVVEHRHSGGDHTIYVGRVLATRVDDRPREDLEPLLYFAGQYRALVPTP